MESTKEKTTTKPEEKTEVTPDEGSDRDPQFEAFTKDLDELCEAHGYKNSYILSLVQKQEKGNKILGCFRNLGMLDVAFAMDNLLNKPQIAMALMALKLMEKAMSEKGDSNEKD